MCGSEHAEEQVPGSPFALMVCPLMPEDQWALVQDKTKTPTPDLLVTPSALAAKAREIQAEPPRPPWEADWSRLFP